MPPCYQRRFLDDSQPCTIDWAEEFQNGGSRMSERKFLCLLLEHGLEIPPWGEDFFLPPGDQFLSWLDASSLRLRKYRQPRTSNPLSIKGVEDGRDVANKFRTRFEAARAAHRGRRPSLPISTLDRDPCGNDQDAQYSGGMSGTEHGRRETVCAESFCPHDLATTDRVVERLA